MQVTIEVIGPEHAAAIQQMASDPEIGRTSNVPSPYPLDGARAFVADATQRRTQGSQHTFAIIGDGMVVGVCSLVNVGGVPPSAQLGYWVGRRYWGRGVATAGGSQVLEFGFQTLGLASVRSSCLPSNTASRRVLEKLGFRPTHLGPPPETSKWPRTQMVEYWEVSRSREAS